MPAPSDPTPATPSEIEIFSQALEMRPEDRETKLAQLCLGDSELLERVQRLLLADQDVEQRWPDSIPMPESELGHPKQIGRYQIRGILGRGGMGVVYEAEQDHPKRRIALKVMQSGHLKERLLRRFETEAQVLGLLSHPGIAQVYEASVVEIAGEPRPYFAMEFIAGKTIDAYTDGRSPSEIAELLALVCDALHHAHQQGVVHRDIKPGNVLVTPDGRPKVLDFGVAHVESGLLEATAMKTQAGEILGTLAFMSPEQVSGKTAQVSPRTDVYSLGVLAYRLLSKRDPLQLEGMPITEISRRIQTQEPSRLGQINGDLAGDLETIVEKAISKDPERRYATASELAADLRRHLGNEPILARTPSTAYYIRKYVARNQALVGGLTATFAALAIGFGISTWLYFDAKASWAAESEALGAAKRAEESTKAALAQEAIAAKNARADQLVADETAQFITALFDEANPYSNPEKLIHPGQFLSLGEARLLSSEHFDPRVKTKLADTLSHLLFGSGYLEKAREWGHRTLEWLGDVPEDQSKFLLDTEVRVRGRLAQLEGTLGTDADAQMHLKTTLALMEAAGQGSTVEAAFQAIRLAGSYTAVGDISKAKAALADGERRYTESGEYFFGVQLAKLRSKASIAFAEGRFMDELPLRVAALELLKNEFPNSESKWVDEESRVIHALENNGKFDAALELSIELMERLNQHLPVSHFRILDARSTHARLRQELGHYEEAAEQYHLLEGPLREVYGEESAKYVQYLRNIAGLYSKAGKLKESDAHYKRAVDLLQEASKIDIASAAQTRLDYAYLLLTHLGRVSDAQPLIERALTDLEAAGVRNSGVQRFGNKAYGMCLSQLGQHEEALVVYRKLLEQQREDMGEFHPDVAETLHNMALSEKQLRRHELALKRHEQCLQVLEQAYPPGHPLFGYCYSGMGDMKYQLQRYEEAEVDLRTALEIREKGLPNGHYMTEVARMSLALVVHKLGRDPEARNLLQSADPILRKAFPPEHFIIVELEKVHRMIGRGKD